MDSEWYTSTKGINEYSIKGGTCIVVIVTENRRNHSKISNHKSNGSDGAIFFPVFFFFMQYLRAVCFWKML